MVVVVVVGELVVERWEVVVEGGVLDGGRGILYYSSSKFSGCPTSSPQNVFLRFLMMIIANEHDVREVANLHRGKVEIFLYQGMISNYMEADLLPRL